MHVPGGKEVDAIHGDLVLKNDRIVAIVAGAARRRNANMSCRNVQGSLIDLALLSTNNDQLTAFRPHGDWTEDRPGATSVEVVKASGSEVSVRAFKAAGPDDPLESETVYTLRDGDAFLRVETRHSNRGDRGIKVLLRDKMRCDQTFEQTPAGAAGLVVFYDRWFGAAYGVTAYGSRMLTDGKYGGMFGLNSGTWIHHAKEVEVPPGGRLVKDRCVIAGRHPADVQIAAEPQLGVKRPRSSVTVLDEKGRPVAGADVRIRRDGLELSAAHTDAEGRADFSLPEGPAVVTVSQIGRGPKVAPLAGAVEVRLGPRSGVELAVTDAAGGPIPCKVQFVGVDQTPSPDLGPKQRHDGCANLFHSADGKGAVALPAGKYYAIVSRGPEYDAVWSAFTLAEGQVRRLPARLVRTVTTTGWVSADFHNHSTPSGDNTTLTEGRLVCLAAEGLDFAAATEHNRIVTYRRMLKSLGLERLLATSDGIELTSTPLPISHHNAFPLHEHPHAQDGGGPEIDPNPLVQLQRLRDHDGGREKLLQQNHPDLGWLVYDRDGDGRPDAGFGTMPLTHVVEIWRPTILEMKPTERFNNVERNNRVFNWLQMLNQGIRVPGVANTDAHYCTHESGRIRNYVRCSTDDPAKIDEMEIVRESKKGRIVMTNGPFLEVSLGGAIPGDDLRVEGRAKLKIRVECPNWLDVDRVQVLRNGRPDPKLNFTRAAHPAVFGDGPVRFRAELDVAFEKDAHVIVVAVGEGSTIGPVMGAVSESPIAVSNPIWVDADGGGFMPDRDTLDAPLPVKRDPDRR
jgi:hypothetical protein